MYNIKKTWSTLQNVILAYNQANGFKLLQNQHPHTFKLSKLKTREPNMKRNKSNTTGNICTCKRGFYRNCSMPTVSGTETNVHFNYKASTLRRRWLSFSSKTCKSIVLSATDNNNKILNLRKKFAFSSIVYKYKCYQQ